MPDVTPAGPLSVAVDSLRSLIAAITWFQTWTASDDATEALTHVFVGDVGVPIAAVGIAAGVLTITTRESHTITAGTVVTITGASVGDQSELDINGAKTVASVTSTTLTFTTLLEDLDTVYPDQAFILPDVRPLAVVSEATDGLRSESIGTGGAAIYSGTLEILLEADVSSSYINDYRNAFYEARNAFGNFLQGLAATQGTADLMCLNRIEPVSGPEFTIKAEQDDNSSRFERWRALIRVTWGLDG